MSSSASPPTSADLDAYFRRVAYAGRTDCSLETLAALHLAHAVAIPFENLNTLLDWPVPLDLGSLEAKLVKGRRGGYCFEQNRLFAEVLRTLGYRVGTLAARVVWNQQSGYLNPRTHMVLLVDLGEPFLCDVGFGGLTLTAPLRLETGREQQTPHELFRLVDVPHEEFELQALLNGDWKPMYRFDLQEQLPIDYEVFNHYVATHPESHFRVRLSVGRATAGGRFGLGNNELSIHRIGKPSEHRRLETGEAIARELRETFLIDVPDTPALGEILARLARGEAARPA